MREDWDERMSVGVESLDAHHRQVWRRVRHLARAVAEGRADEVRAALRLVEHALADHDPGEDRVMEEAGYPGAREHARSHGVIRERVRAACEGTPATPLKLLETAEWLAEALREHFAKDDLRLGRFLTARENLRRLAEEGPGAGLSLTPVPGTLRPVARAPREADPAAAGEEPSGGAPPPRRRG